MNFTVLYERYSTYSTGDEIRKASIENIESKSLNDLLDNINSNQKFLSMREDDVIDFSKIDKDKLEETGFNLVSITDDSNQNIYHRDVMSNSAKESTIIINTYIGSELYDGDEATIDDIKKILKNQVTLMQNIFTSNVNKIELLIGDYVCVFDENRGYIEDSFTFEVSDIENIETIINKNTKKKISDLFQEGCFCFNYYIADKKFENNYNSLHELIHIIIEIIKYEESFFHIFHIPSNEYLSIDECPDMEGSEDMVDEFIKYIE